jgi:hypothetical protein
VQEPSDSEEGEGKGEGEEQFAGFPEEIRAMLIKSSHGPTDYVDY